MKKLLTLLLLVGSCSFLDAQNEQSENRFHNRKQKNGCDEVVQRLDSVVGYIVDPVSRTEIADYVLRYNYVNGLCISTTKHLIQGNTPVYKQLFSYDEDGNLIEYIYQTWSDSKWKNTTLTTYLYNENLLIKEVFSRAQTDGAWLPYQQHFYENSDGRAINYLRQVKDSQGNWYDFAHHFFIYDEAGNLVVLYGEYIKNNLVYWRRTSNFNTERRIIDRYLEVLRYDFDEGRNILKNELHQIFSYDVYFDISEISSETIVDGEWTETARLEYHWSVWYGKKVSICHNGQTICVSANAVKAHLAHGDKLGSCDETSKDTNRKKEEPFDNNKKASEIKIKIYPNPTDGKVSIEFKNADHGFSGVSLISSTGSQLDYYQIEGMISIDISINSFRSGSYLLHFYGEGGDVWKTIVKK